VHWRAMAGTGVLWRALACSGVHLRALACNVCMYVCMYVLNFYPALSQKRSNDGRVCYDLHYLQNEGNAKENR
jgi:hypothetical protein